MKKLILISAMALSANATAADLTFDKTVEPTCGIELISDSVGNLIFQDMSGSYATSVDFKVITNVKDAVATVDVTEIENTVRFVDGSRMEVVLMDGNANPLDGKPFDATDSIRVFAEAQGNASNAAAGEHVYSAVLDVTCASYQ